MEVAHVPMVLEGAALVEGAAPVVEEAACAVVEAARPVRRTARSNAWVAPTGHHNRDDD